MARRVIESEKFTANGLVMKEMGRAKEVELKHEITVHKTHGGLFSCQLNYDGSVLATGWGNGGIDVYDVATATRTQVLRESRQGGAPIMTLKFHPKNDDLLYAGSADGMIYVFRVKTGLLELSIEETGNEIFTMDFSVDGYNFTTGGKDLAVRVYETNKNRLLRTYEGYNVTTFVHDKNTIKNTMRVFSIKFHPDNQFIFVSGGWDNHLKIWDIRDNEGIKRNIAGPHICGDTIDMKDNNILTGQWTALHALQTFDYTNGVVTNEIKFPNKNGAFLYTSQFANKNTVIAGGSGTNSMEVLEISTNRHIGGYKSDGPVLTADSACDGAVIVAGGATNKFAILKMTD